MQLIGNNNNKKKKQQMQLSGMSVHTESYTAKAGLK